MSRSLTQRASRGGLSPFLTLCGVGLFAIFSSTMSKNPALPLFAKDLGATEADIGFIAAASTVVGVISSLPAGALSDLYGRRRVILAATLVFASAPFLYLLVGTPGQLAAVRVYHGFATAIFGPVAMALVADLFRTGRGEQMGWYSSATLVGRAAAPFVGGSILAVAAMLGMGLGGFRVVYVVCGIGGLIALYGAWRLPIDNRTRGGATFAETWVTLRAGLRDVVRSRPILVTSASEALQYFSYGALETFLPLYAVYALGLSTVEVGTVFLIQVLTTALSKPLFGRTSDRMGRRPMIALGLVVSAAALGLVALIGTFGLGSGSQMIVFGLLLVAGALYGLGLSVVTSSTSAYVSELAKAGSYGSAMGVLSTIMDVGHSTGPMAMGLLVVGLGYSTSFGIVAALLVVGTLAFLTLAPPRGDA